jgi:hypothetical protein
VSFVLPTIPTTKDRIIRIKAMGGEVGKMLTDPSLGLNLLLANVHRTKLSLALESNACPQFRARTGT